MLDVTLSGWSAITTGFVGRGYNPHCPAKAVLHSTGKRSVRRFFAEGIWLPQVTIFRSTLSSGRKAACGRIERTLAEMAQGTIKKLTDKGFGFIGTEKGDLFFHLSSIQGTTFEQLHEGQTVEYVEGHGPKGPRAESVRPVG